jgi:O-antigen ligase
MLLLLFLPAVQDRLSGEEASTTLNWRLTVWDASLKVLEKSTAIGYGLDTSPILVNRELVNVVAPPHNDYLRNAIETGVIGIGLFILLQLALFSLGRHAYQQQNKDLIRVMGLALMGITIGGVVISVSDNYFSYVSVQWYNWTIIGLISVKSVFRIPDDVQPLLD